jgi:hypothetical protein
VNWEAIGAFAELIGAAGVIITLAYLAVQIRHSSIQLQRNFEASRIVADDAVVRGFNEWRALMIADDDVSDLYIRGVNAIETLTPSERLRFNQLMSSFIWTCWQLWRSQELLGTPNLQIFRHMLRHSGGREWYESHKDYFPDDFRAMLESVLAEIKRDGLEDIPPEASSSMFAGALKQK